MNRNRLASRTLIVLTVIALSLAAVIFVMERQTGDGELIPPTTANVSAFSAQQRPQAQKSQQFASQQGISLVGCRYDPDAKAWKIDVDVANLFKEERQFFVTAALERKKGDPITQQDTFTLSAEETRRTFVSIPGPKTGVTCALYDGFSRALRG
jgi:hypothetical protein